MGKQNKNLPPLEIRVIPERPGQVLLGLAVALETTASAT